ncbi:hypothetical protein [Vulgatibacter incomptus]|uniref:Lipoprotein n=1 Tax=Vulgatibacter incomptus TaxID=1391653 RepID=A0A0K1PE16_9BACT|nr:hypothetical protein [Vulgatibacter incomptus]AKU91778.1 hypothetical protein AKJ08_2165 [Vulgatibacter incomptus]
MHRPSYVIVAVVFAVLLAASGCSSAEDRAAKARIFSPEDPPKVLQAAAQTLDARKLDRDPAGLDRILSIPAAEAVARIGPHVQDAKVSFRWSRSDKDVKLSEERHVALGPDGDFHVRIENDERQGMEWIKLDGVSYTRSRYGRFRERRRDRGSSEHVVASAYDSLATFHDLVHGAMKLSPKGEGTVEGRKVVQYTVSLGEPRKDEGEAALPPVVFPKNGPDSDTTLRLAAAKEGRPSAASGTLRIDAETGVPLGADLEATLVVPAAEGRPEAHLELSIHLEVRGVGKDPKIAVPEHLDDAPRPPGVVATLRAYGLEKAPEKPEAAEPADED